MATPIPNTNPFNYSNRTFTTIYSELSTIYPNRPDWFLRIIAGQMDIGHWYLDSRAQNLILSTSYTVEATRDLAAYLDYYPDNASPGGGDITVEVASSPITIPKEQLLFSIQDEDGDVYNFEATADLTISSGLTGDVPVLEGSTQTDVSLGQSDGVTEWQEFVIPDTGVILGLFGSREPVVITIDGDTWENKETLVNSTSSDRHFRILTKPSGITAVMFGNGGFGMIPPAGFPILATYRTGGGTGGNIRTTGAVVAYTGPNVNVVGGTMAANFTGGAEAELMAKTKRLAPQMLRTNYRAVTEQDIVTLSEQYSSSIIKAVALPGLYGSGTIGVHIVPAGGGTPTASLKSSLEAYLTDRASLANADIRVRDPLYQAEDITAGLKMRTGYSFATYKNYAEIVCYLLLSEVSQEVLDRFEQNGVADVASFFNTKWGYSFTSTDYTELSRILLRRKRDGATSWGGDLVPNDIIAALDDLTGVEFPTVTTPASIVTVSFNRIMTEGTVTISEIT